MYPILNLYAIDINEMAVAKYTHTYLFTVTVVSPSLTDSIVSLLSPVTTIVPGENRFLDRYANAAANAVNPIAFQSKVN